jgi:cell wall-associated NlpC family hydrolase
MGLAQMVAAAAARAKALGFAALADTPATIHHVGMYVGQGLMEQAPPPGPWSGSTPCGPPATPGPPAPAAGSPPEARRAR